MAEDTERIKVLMTGANGIRKVANCVPHDIGDPGKLQLFSYPLFYLIVFFMTLYR